MFVFVVLILRIQIATQESAGEDPAPTAHYKLLPNKNNLCAGCRAQTLSGRLKGGGEQWRGRRRDLSSWLTTSFFFFSCTIQTNLQPEIRNCRSSVVRSAFATLCCVLSVSQFTFPRLLSIILHLRRFQQRHFSC